MKPETTFELSEEDKKAIDKERIVYSSEWPISKNEGAQFGFQAGAEWGIRYAREKEEAEYKAWNRLMVANLNSAKKVGEQQAERIKELENENNALKIQLDATRKLLEMHDWAKKETDSIGPVVIKYYYAKDMHFSGLEFLKDATRYASARNPAMTEGKTWFQLCGDWANKVDFDKHTRF